MPTYEYQCADCDYKFEKFQSMSASALRKCPKCGKASLKRLIGTGAGVIFKGSGFHETDYRSESYRNAAKKETGSGKTEKKETKAETKTSSTASTLRQSSVQAGSPQEEKKPAKSKNESKSG
jgi:putative FmdB family regulatory protein